MSVTETSNNWLPAGAVTGIGSLPHQDADQAVRFVARHCPAMPFWPQLPQRAVGEQMIAQTASPLAHLLSARSEAGYG